MSVGEDVWTQWRGLLTAAAARYGTPCYVMQWQPIEAAAASLDRLTTRSVLVRSWLSFKTHPVLPLLRQWLHAGRGVEVVSECELVTAVAAGADSEHLLVNGVAKHAWLSRYHVPGLRVHLDSLGELRELKDRVVEDGWRVGVRCHAPDECDRRDPRFGGQFGMTEEEAIAALMTLRDAGADVQGLHVHLAASAHLEGAYRRAVEHLHRICTRASFRPRYIDLGGGLPTDPSLCVEGRRNLQEAIAAAAAAFAPELEEVWLENGRYVTEASTAVVVRVLDVKDRENSAYLICDGGRTNQALAADAGPHPLLIVPERRGSQRLTTVCGPTCMTDDVLVRRPLPEDVAPGDLIAWMNAGAYHLPWETRFSHGQCAVVWCNANDELVLARPREHPDAWASAWNWSAA